MSTKSNTERAQCVFTAKESSAGAPFWIAFEPYGGNLSVLGNGLLGFDLPEGASFEKANEIAGFLNDNIRAVSCTTFEE